MRKLFTSLLLLGAVTASQAQVSVTGYDATNSSVTINFTYDGARPTPEKVENAIKAAFEGENPTIARLGKPEREKITTVKLTGDWNNVDIDPTSYEPGGVFGNLSINKIVKEFTDPGKRFLVTLDLSECQGFESKYQGVRDTRKALDEYGNTVGNEIEIPANETSEGYINEWLETYFTSLPVPQAGSSSTETVSVPVTVNTVSKDVTLAGIPVTYVNSEVTVNPNAKKYTWNNNGNFIDVIPGDISSLPDWAQANCSFVQGLDGWYIIAWGSPHKLIETDCTTYTYRNENDNLVTQYNSNGLRQDGDNWFYTRYVYDLNGNHYVESTAPNDMVDNNGTYIIPNSYSYENENGERITQDHHNNLRRDGDKWYYDYLTYTYTDENGQQVTTANRYTQGLTENNGTFTYEYDVTTVTDPVCKFAIDKEINLGGIIFPVSDNFTFIPNNLFKDNETVKTAVLSNKIVAIGNKAFGGATHLEEVNFPSSIQEIGYGAFKTTKITEAKLAACTNLSRIRFETFQECSQLTEVTFPTKIKEIQKEAFMKCPLVEVDLSQCHDLEMIAGMSFDGENGCEYSIQTVTLCSHPKIIRGTSVKNGGNSNGAFHLCLGIKKVEIIGCENTCVSECVCENRGFEWDITHYQTAAPSDVYDKVAELIYPHDLPACEGSGYTSSFDFFEGDYKAGTMITQETLLCYYRQIPNTGSGSGKFVWMEEDPNNPGQMTQKEETRTVTADNRYIGNGWLEFIKTGSTTVVPKGEFLRTYSRTAGTGPCLLPKDITAYRAVDYKSNQVGWVLDKNRKTGTHYLKEGATDLTADASFVLITPETDPADYANRPLYSKVTTSGKLYLRPLVAKVAEWPLVGDNKTIGYTEENQDYFDSEEIYSQLQPVPGGYSYVPEETGVVLYSRSLLEEAFLVLGGDFGTETVYKKFPHTGDRYEEGRMTSSNTDNDINMLQGSFGTGVPVAPVFPWVYKNKTACTGGHYTDNKEYRNFAVVKIESNGGSVIEDRYRWKRLTPSKMKVNRAFAQIPVNRFDNWNENVDQMPDFTIEDEVQSENGANMMLISIFGDEEQNGETDGIEEIKTADFIVVKANDNAWYTIQGVRVAQPTKGVYIHNGKKVVID